MKKVGSSSWEIEADWAEMGGGGSQAIRKRRGHSVLPEP